MLLVESCPNCGADLPREARVCPECGSDDETGWSEAAASSHLNLPDDSFNYEEFVEKEFGTKKKARPGLPWIWWLTAAILLLLMAAALRHLVWPSF